MHPLFFCAMAPAALATMPFWWGVAWVAQAAGALIPAAAAAPPPPAPPPAPLPAPPRRKPQLTLFLGAAR